MLRSPTHLLALAALALAGLPLSGQQLQCQVEQRTFHVPDQGPRIELDMLFHGQSLTMAPNADGYNQSRVSSLVMIERDGELVDFAKTEVLGPQREDTMKLDFLHRELFDLSPGEYDLVLELRDLNSTDTAAARFRLPLAVEAPAAGVFFSDIVLAERMEKAREGDAMARSGYSVVPAQGDYYPRTVSSLNFYVEIYQADKVLGEDAPFLITYQIEMFESGQVFGAFKRPVRSKAKAADAVMARFDIGGLPSGNYVLSVEARDREGELLARTERFFQRNNPVSYDPGSMASIDVGNTFVDAMTNPDTLAEYISSLRAIADPLERKIIDDRWKDRDLELMQRFFYSFWANRNGHDPESAWKEYRDAVIQVNRLFGCRVLKGYQTDRGMVYLKYGAPNTMMDRFNETDAYPYSIWHYYRAGKYTNRRFVFYQRELVGDCFELLHAEVPGEVQNPRWNQIIHSRNVPMQNLDPQRVMNPSGERLEEFFELPR
jgi:GWxTD domain-containing protein